MWRFCTQLMYGFLCRLHFSMQGEYCVFFKVFLSPCDFIFLCSTFCHCCFSAVPPEGSKITYGIWVLLWPLRTEISLECPKSFHSVIHYRMFSYIDLMFLHSKGLFLWFLIRMSDDERRGERIFSDAVWWFVWSISMPSGLLFSARYFVQHWYYVMVYQLNELRLISSRGGFCVKVCRQTTGPNLYVHYDAWVSALASSMRSPPTVVPHPSSVPQCMSGWQTVRLSQAIHRLRENSIDLCSEVVGVLWSQGGGDKCCTWLSYWDSVNRFRPALSVVCLCARWKKRRIERLKGYFSPPRSSISASVQCWAQISRWFTIEPLLCLLTAVILQGTVRAALPKYHV